MLLNVCVASSFSVKVVAVAGSVPKDLVYPKSVVFGSSSGMVCLWMITLRQFVRLMLAGRMKACSCEVKESDERLFSIALPNDVRKSRAEAVENSGSGGPSLDHSTKSVLIADPDP